MFPLLLGFGVVIQNELEKLGVTSLVYFFILMELVNGNKTLCLF